MEIESFSKQYYDAWNEFVISCPEGSFFHLAQWIAITEKYYGFSSYSFLIRKAGEIVAIVPLFLCRSPFLGRCLISTPICGLLCPCTTSPEAKELIMKHLWQLLDITHARFLELRSDEQSEIPGLPTIREHILQRLTLGPDETTIWKNLAVAVRNQTRQAQKWGLSCESGVHYLPQFYRIYARNMRDFSYPLLSRRFFTILQREFKDIFELLVVMREGQVLGALINFYFKDTVTNLWAVSLKKYQKMRINNFIYWEALKKACREGYKIFDFGRARKDSGVYHFKKQWGTTNIPLSYQYLSRRKFKLPGVEETQKKYRLPMAVWRRLPLWLTRIVGPPLGKMMPL